VHAGTPFSFAWQLQLIALHNVVQQSPVDLSLIKELLNPSDKFGTCTRFQEFALGLATASKLWTPQQNGKELPGIVATRQLI
jgi:hypothetical protein